ncbi:hypothetical protein RFI_31769 [Reticulomyxa filosa]|uniref:RanBP2-type domain-containing protein n=1 Tax=Reticulomyxa filosa TaxID=46433 RepID=X6LY17_RETFI|nr:hypothetical protein RFI_31769 [Reticulomyxa filosa]|eukprot:ETO05625.1 hypothetical protein RFI_31769 [Reticulomyxa filosa]
MSTKESVPAPSAEGEETSAKESVSTTPSGSYWKCTECMLVNEDTAKVCEACFVERKKESKTVTLSTTSKWAGKKRIWSSQEAAKKQEEKKEGEEEEEKNEYLKPIEYEIRLTQRPYGFSLCKEMDEKYVCKVIPEGFCGQWGMICGSECIAIDSLLLDGNNWSYVNKKYPDVPFFYMPDFDKVQYLQNPKDLNAKPIVLRLRFDAMKMMSLGQSSEDEKCESWPILQKELFQTLIETKPQNFRALQTIQVFKELPFQATDHQPIYTIQQGQQFQAFLQAGAFLQVRFPPPLPSIAWAKRFDANKTCLAEQLS